MVPIPICAQASSNKALQQWAMVYTIPADQKAVPAVLKILRMQNGEPLQTTPRRITIFVVVKNHFIRLLSPGFVHFRF
jgi:hypothetical protein